MPDDGSKGMDEVKITVGAPAPGGVVAAVPAAPVAEAAPLPKATKVRVTVKRADATVSAALESIEHPVEFPCRADDGSVTVDLPPLTPGDTITIEAL